MNRECMKLWRKDGFTLRIFWPPVRRDSSRDYYAYQFKDGRKVIFEGDDFSPGAFTCPDSLDAVYSLLGFLSLQDGDTDEGYFRNYTPAQLAWRDSRRAEELGMLVYLWEEKRTR